MSGWRLLAIEDVVKRAKDYPFDVPGYDYVFAHGEAWRIQTLDLNRFPETVLVRGVELRKLAEIAPRLRCLSQLNPLLAYGSNAAISRLKEKFCSGQAAPIVMLRGELHDFDVTFSAHFTAYGSIPATLARSIGTVVKVFVMYASDEDLEILHASESVGVNYAYMRLDGIRLGAANLLSLRSVHAYISKYGSLDIALKAVPARDRILPSMTALEVLTWARDRLEPGQELERFIAEVVLDEEVRRRRTNSLRRWGKPFRYDMAFVVRG